MRTARPILGLLAGFSALLVLALAATPASASLGQTNGTIDLFIRSARENADQTQVTFPLHRGTSGGQTVWYVVTEAADRGIANSMGVNYAPKLEAASGTSAVQAVRLNADGSIDFPATVTFGLQRVVVPGCAPTNSCSSAPRTAFPPAAVSPPAVGNAGYSPLIQLPDGTILNAPQIANSTGKAEKVASLDTVRGTAIYRETEGRYDNRVVHYVSFDASDFGAASLEDVTYAPALGAAPQTGCADPAVALQPCSREPLIAFINGRTLAIDPANRQGLDSAILDGLSPLNILKEIPEGQADPGFPAYSPLWDIHAATWTDAAIAAGQDTRQADFGTVVNLSLGPSPLVTLAAAGFIVNCPAVSMNPSR